MTETETVPSEAGEGASTTSSQYIITAYEDAFKDRYTETDKEYIKTKETKLPDPPCVENWYSKPKRSWDWSREGEKYKLVLYNFKVSITNGEHTDYTSGDHISKYNRGQGGRYENQRGYRGRGRGGNRGNWRGGYRDNRNYGNQGHQRYDNYGQGGRDRGGHRGYYGGGGGSGGGGGNNDRRGSSRSHYPGVKRDDGYNQQYNQQKQNRYHPYGQQQQRY